MTISTWVIARDPVAPRVLFDVAGDPQDCCLHDIRCHAQTAA